MFGRLGARDLDIQRSSSLRRTKRAAIEDQTRSRTLETDLAIANDDADGTIIGYSEAAGSAQPEVVSVGLTANTSYIVRVAGWEGDGGAWTLSLY